MRYSIEFSCKENVRKMEVCLRICKEFVRSTQIRVG